MNYVFYANCIPVEGFKRVAIVDLQRDNTYLMPKNIYAVLALSSLYKIDTYFSLTDSEVKKDEFNEWINFLTENEIIFDTDEPESFPPIPMDYFSWSNIENCIIDIRTINSNDYYQSIFSQLESLLCRHLQIRFFSSISFDQLKQFLSLLSEYPFEGIEIIFPYHELFNVKNLSLISEEYNNIFLFVIYGSPFKQINISKNHNKSGNIIFITSNIDSEAHCGIISVNNFVLNIKTFSESQKNNTCLNRKISIDVNGEIKNCPSMTKGYGNIRNTTLKQAMDTTGFKDLWYIHKDQVDVCKDCEFRHICTDCRAYIQDPDNIYSKPAKCSYDPYTATWGESNPTNNLLYGK